VVISRFTGGYDRSRPRLRALGIPSGCVAHRFRLRVRVTDASPIARIKVSLDGRRLGAVARRSLSLRVVVRPPGRHRLRISAEDAAGNVRVLVRRLRACAG
jgi:hypothetical protein